MNGDQKTARRELAKTTLRGAPETDGAERGDVIGDGEAEMALLGCLLFEPEPTMAAIGDLIRTEDFAEPTFAAIFHQARTFLRGGATVDPVTIAHALKDHPGLCELGGLRFLADLMERAPPGLNTPAYARIITDCAARRNLAHVAHEIRQEAAHDPEGLGAALIPKAEKRLAELAQQGPTRQVWATAPQVIRSAIASARARGGRIDYPSGLSDVDATLGGFSAGELAIIAARPGVGKSVVGMTVARASAQLGKGTVFFSLEMANEPLGLRLGCDLAYDRLAPIFSGVSTNPTYDRARKGTLSSEQWDRLSVAAQEAEDWPLVLDTRPGLTVSQMEAAALRAYRDFERRGIARGPLVLDHLGIVTPEADRKGNKVAETGDVSRALARAAKHLAVPVIALCQLNRQSEARPDKRPELADLRWSGEIEADARQVILLHRPELYLSAPLGEAAEDALERAERETRLDKVRRKLFWIIAKNNNGPTGAVETFCDIGCSAIRDRNPAAWERRAA